MADVAVYIPVTMLPEELGACAYVAATHTLNAIARNGQHTAGLKDGEGELGIERNFISAVSEMATAKWLNLYWSAWEIGAIDVGYLVEVRGVEVDSKRLFVFPWDKDKLPFVSVLVTRAALPVVYLRGWMVGGDIKRTGSLENPKNRPGGGVYYAPNEALRPMTELLRLVRMKVGFGC